MSKLQILFLAWSISVIVLSILIILFRYVYLKELNRKTSSTESVKGSVVGYRYYTDAIAPIVEYIVNDKAYRRSLEYEWVTTVSLPWKSSKPPLIQTCWLKDLLYTPIRQYHMPPKISFQWDQP